MALDALFPRRCAVCDTVLPFGGGKICASCAEKLVPVRDPRCMKCGRMLYSNSAEYCRDCADVKHAFDRAVSAFVYNDAMQESIFRYKYGGRKEYADFYAETMAQYLGKEIRSFKADALIPVPLHKSRLRKRGFNQSALIARKLGKILDIDVAEKLVERVKRTSPQKNLNREERRKNLKRAFKISKNDVKLTRVIIVDDIYTTGSTVDEIALLLRAAGVREVYVATLCSGSPI